MSSSSKPLTPSEKCAVCEQPAIRRCSGCKITFYCTPDHQKDHWKAHKNDCRPFQIAQSADLGKYMVASRDLQPSDVIFTETPLVFGPQHHRIDKDAVPCVGCCQIIDENCAQCPDCLWPACSVSCAGLKNNYRHALECRILQLRRPTSDSNFFDFFRFDVLVVLRALFLQKLNKTKWEDMMRLEDHLDKRGPGTEPFKVVEEQAKFLHENYFKPLKQLEEENGKTILENCSSDMVHKIYAIMDVNGMEVTEEVHATILYFITSILEHNCTPNTCQTMESNPDYRITFRAASNIAKGANITSIYTHILWGTHQRRFHLKSTKYFSCTCARCKDPTEFGTYLSALKCLGTEQDACNGTQLPVNPTDEKIRWVCDTCKIRLPNDELMKFVDHLGGEVDKVLAKKPTIGELEELLAKLGKFLHPHHFHVYMVKHSLVQLDGVEVEEKRGICEDLIGVTRKIDPGNARLSLYLAVLLHELFLARWALFQRKEGHGEELGKLLEEAEVVLEWQKESGAGAKLLGVLQATRAQFRDWQERSTNN